MGQLISSTQYHYNVSPTVSGISTLCHVVSSPSPTFEQSPVANNQNDISTHSYMRLWTIQQVFIFFNSMTMCN